MNNDSKKRCAWVSRDPMYIRYHDEEWGVPVYEDHKLFSALILDTQQAGLSWITVLKKRENYREALDSFDPSRIALYDETKIQKLLQNQGLIRNKKKIHSIVQNARAFLRLQEEFGTFDRYLESILGQRKIIHTFRSLEDLPSKTQDSENLSRDLKKRGFSFVGPTIVYAFMQGVGWVNDHLRSCFRYTELTRSP